MAEAGDDADNVRDMYKYHEIYHEGGHVEDREADHWKQHLVEVVDQHRSTCSQ